MEVRARLRVHRVLLTRGRRPDRRFPLFPITASQPQSNVRPGNSRASIVEAALVDKEIEWETPANDTLLKVENRAKRFPVVVALAKATLEAPAGKAHGTRRDNRAGEPMPFKAPIGAYWPDSDAIHFEGHNDNRLTPRKATDIGAACVFQKKNLIPQLTATENISLDRWISISRSVDLLDRAEMRVSLVSRLLH